ncbi:MAG: YebC/PmpR family DNA-binding transcriptional regulator [Legionellaceae bacterium]|nr:YebC/PmpR family DNA-binding transcriptional regulator [Legionellaceae bacterium]
MAGHSKWANIKHKKAKMDKIKGKVLSRCAREIIVAAKTGPDPAMNPRLRLAIEKARAANMTKDKIENAIKKGSGEGGADNIEEIRYEGYGPNGVAVMVDCMTDNKNRTVGEVRHAFSKSGGNMGTDGSVSYLFNKRGVLTFAKGADESKLMEVGLDAGAEDIVSEPDGTFTVLTSEAEFVAVKEAFENAGLQAEEAAVTMEPTTKVELDQEGAEKVMKLLDMLEDLDDTQEVYSNAEFPDDMAD